MRERVASTVWILLSIVACSSKSVNVNEASGGADAGGATDKSTRGGDTSRSSGGATSTTASQSAGAGSSAVATTATGGTNNATGGTSAATTGTTVATGGTSAATTGTAVAAGGTTTTTTATTVNPCLTAVCASPPANDCANSTTLRTYAAAGTCVNGACGYTSTQTTCKTGAICSSGSCSCTGSLVECTQGCLDLKTDANNCGACGHSCLGGTCSNGLCQPIVLASNQTAVEALSLDTSHVYWARSTEVDRVSKSGGTVEPLAVNQSPRSVASDGTYVYWGNASNSAVRRMLLGNVDYSDLAATALPVEDMQLYGDWLYYVENSILTGGSSFVRRVAKTGGTAQEIATSTGGALELAVVGDCVYYSKVYSKQLAMKCPATSRDITVVDYLNYGFEADNSGVYFGDADGLKVLSLSTGAVSTLVAGVAAGRITLDAAFVYYVEGTSAERACGSDWRIWKIAKSGGAPTLLVNSPLACPSFLKVDATALYWAATDDGTIMKLAK